MQYEISPQTPSLTPATTGPSTSAPPEEQQQQLPSPAAGQTSSSQAESLAISTHLSPTTSAASGHFAEEQSGITTPSSLMLINGLEAGQPIAGESSSFGDFGSGGSGGGGAGSRSHLDGRSAQGGRLSSDTTCENTPIISTPTLHTPGATPSNEPISNDYLAYSGPSQHELATQASLSLVSQASSSSSSSTPLEISNLNLWSGDSESCSASGGGGGGGGASLSEEHSHYTYGSHTNNRPSSPSPYFGYQSPDSEASSSSQSASYSLSYDQSNSHSSSASPSSSSLSGSSLSSEENSEDVDSSSDGGTHDYDDSSGLSHGLHGSDQDHHMDYQSDSEALSSHAPDFTVEIDVFPDEHGNIPSIYIDHGNEDSSDYHQDGEGEDQYHSAGNSINWQTISQSNGTQTIEGGVGMSYGLPDIDEDEGDNSYTEGDDAEDDDNENGNDDDDDDEDDNEDEGNDGELDDDDYEDDFDDEGAMDVSDDQGFYVTDPNMPNQGLIVDINGLSLFPNTFAQFFVNQNPAVAGALAAAVSAAGGFDDEGGFDVMDPYVVHDFERNSCFVDFIKNLWICYRHDPVKYAHYKISTRANEVRSFPRPAEVTAEDVENGSDLQGIAWDDLEIERERARVVRNGHYSNYANLRDRNEPDRRRTLLPNTRKFYKFRRTDNKIKVRFTHFQLRNLVTVASRNDVYYTGDCQVLRYDAGSKTSEVTMDLLNPEEGDPIKITTIAGSHGVLLAGGFSGEYGMKAMDAPLYTKPVEGIVTTDGNGITNHIHVFGTRMSGLPQAVFSSNDKKLRILDCTTNTFVAEHSMKWPINCSATSPCGRLRAIVGDATEVVITDSERGTILSELHGHLDYGFACAWAEDGYTIATGNQDMMVRIWDARNFSRSVASIDAEIAGVRTLRFSPLGSGPRVLAMAEPADFISIVDAVDFQTQQKYDVFGEIGGLGFTPDTGDLFVANADRTVGGLMEFERRGEGRIVGNIDWLPEDDLRPDRTRRRRKASIIDGPYLY